MDYSQDDGFCFSKDGKLFFNIERQGDGLYSAISVYDTADFSRIDRLLLDMDTMIDHIEFDNETDDVYVLGSARGDAGHFFVAKYKDNSITDIVKMPEAEFEFYQTFFDLKIMGFTEKAYEWSFADHDLEEIKSLDLSLAKFHKLKSAVDYDRYPISDPE